MAEQVRPAVDDQLRGRYDKQRGLSEMSSLVEQAVAALFAEGDEAEVTARTLLEQLRLRAEEAVVAIARLEAGCPRRMYPRRWALMHFAALLHHDAALPFLREVVLTPIPPEESTNVHYPSTLREETVLRVTAVEGVGVLAARGNERAIDSLLEFLSIESISIRRASAMSLLAVDEGMRDQIADLLPRQLHYLLDIRSFAVTEVPQVRDPQQHLREPGRPEKRQAPAIGTRHGEDGWPPPQVGR
jgi:hypothetical protein